MTMHVHSDERVKSQTPAKGLIFSGTMLCSIRRSAKREVRYGLEKTPTGSKCQQGGPASYVFDRLSWLEDCVKWATAAVAGMSTG